MGLARAVVLLMVSASSVDLDPQLRASAHLEVSPAPLPSSLPLVHVPGRDAFGRPRSWVDGRAFRSLLDARRWKALSAYLEKLQDAFEKDPRDEEWVEDAFGVLAGTDSTTLLLVDAWARATPGSFAPYLARAECWMDVAFLRRGGDWASRTKAEEFSAFATALDRAMADLDRAMALRPRSVVGHALRIQIESARGNHRGRDEALRRAVDACPTCFEPREAYLAAISPRWGGSYDDMQAFTEASVALGNPRLKLLRASASLDRCSLAWHENRIEDARRECDAAVEVGPSATTLLIRGDLRQSQGDIAGALSDFERALAQEPGSVRGHARRASALAASSRWAGAGADELFARQAGLVARGNATHSAIVLHLAQLGWAEHVAHHRDLAVRLLSLARSLSPGDPDLEARLRLASGRGARKRAAAAAAPGGERHAIAVSGHVVDERGSPVAGARVFALHARSPADILTSYRRDEAGAVRSGPDGGFAITVPPGPTIFVATTEVPFRSCGTARRVDGASEGPITLGFAGAESIAGIVRNTAGTPVSGVQVRAFDDVSSASGETFGIGFTDSSGRFSIGGLRDGKHRLYARGNQHWTIDWDGRPVDTGPQPTVLSVSKVGLLRGRVVQSLPGGDTAPLQAFTIHDPELGAWPVESADGTFEIPVRRSWSKMSVIVEALGRAPLTLVVDAKAGARMDLGDLVLGRGRTVSGRVIDEAGSPVADAAVTAGGRSYAWRPTSDRTDASGRFRLEWLSGGSGVVYVTHREFQAVELTVVPGDADVEIRVSRGETAAFRVEDVDARPLPGVGLRVPGPSRSECRSDAEGLCSLRGLPPGEFALDAGRLPDGSRTPTPRQMRFSVPQQSNPLIYRYPRARSVLRVRTTGPSGQPERSWLLLVPGQFSRAAWVDAGGRVRQPHYGTGYLEQHEIDDLPRGDYTVLAISAADASRCTVATVQLVEGAERQLDLSLVPGDCPKLR